MKHSMIVSDLLKKIKDDTKLGDIRKMAADIRIDHALALELWNSGKYLARQLAILLFDKKLLSESIIDNLTSDIAQHNLEEQTQLMDWLMANQLSKNKKTVAIMESWKESPESLQRRIFWYHQGRLRWMGHEPPPNTEMLLEAIERDIEMEKPEVQWAMNFTAAQIGIHQPTYRSRCITIGEKSGLYRDEIVSRGCTPNYLPHYIAIEVAKRQKKLSDLN